MGADADFIGGHGILALERFMDETRHMIIFDVLPWEAPVGDKGERLRLILSDEGYAKAFIVSFGNDAICILTAFYSSYYNVSITV